MTDPKQHQQHHHQQQQHQQHQRQVEALQARPGTAPAAQPLLPSAAQELLAGFAAGAANVTSGYPFDTIKVRMQSAAPGRYRGALHCLRELVATEGVRRGLFRGLTSPLVGGAAETGVNYLVYSRLLEALQPSQPPRPHRQTDGPHAGGGRTRGSVGSPEAGSPPAAAAPPPAPPPPLHHVALAGAVAGVCLSVILGPTELVKCRMQQAGSASRYPGGPLQCLARIVATEGGALRGLSRGLGATLAREVPGNALFFTAYEGLRRLLLPGATAPASTPAAAAATPPPPPPNAAAAAAPRGEAQAPGGTPPPSLSPPPAAAAAAMATAAAEGEARAPTGRHWLTEVVLAVFCGGAAGTIMWAAVLPIDVAKTRLQTATPGSAWDVGLRRHWVLLWREGRLASLYAGLVPTLARAFPANACQWLAWELAMRGLQGGEEGQEERVGRW